MLYLAKTPWWLQKLYPHCSWQMPAGNKKIYLSFDDGPHPVATPFVLETLKRFDARATFFCIGKNVVEYPLIYRQLLDEGHRVGNHTYHHLNGWKTPDATYVADITEAAKFIDSTLFRPPYGRATRFQLKVTREQLGLRPVMWSVLSGDFDPSINGQRCFENVVTHAGDGSIIVFHDSAKAFEKMAFALPKVLEYFAEKGFQFSAIGT